MNLLMFGPQGSGKGTQADLLAHKYDLIHIETGQIFREIGREDSDLGKRIKSLNDRKEMIPDDITIKIIEEYLKKIPKEKGIILDSAPRTAGQIGPVEKIFEQIGRKIDHAVYIKLPYDESVSRITKRYACTLCYRHFILGKDIQDKNQSCPTCGGPVKQRGDDTPDGIAKRLKVFYEVTVPVIEHYRQKNILIEVDGNGTIKEVFEAVDQKIISNLK